MALGGLRTTPACRTRGFWMPLTNAAQVGTYATIPFCPPDCFSLHKPRQEVSGAAGRAQTQPQSPTQSFNGRLQS